MDGLKSVPMKGCVQPISYLELQESNNVYSRTVAARHSMNIDCAHMYSKLRT